MTCPKCESTNVKRGKLLDFLHGGLHVAGHQLKHAGLAGVVASLAMVGVYKVVESCTKHHHCLNCEHQFI